ncbi:MAG TPA: HEPN domain-containing protein [Flavobacterium sp.]|uniref:HEPN domain-containing protein n=1 Tax=unclassified Flavobacterium TaxID=196869 RepID=UPI0025C588ED|nr:MULTISPECIES: HEPN domain-containing protein [unclassified Flavobacterium]HRE79259.1 HEPN domain-containing protein [Flavobacterium sp.]
MRKFLWFTHTNIDCTSRKDFSFDLTSYLSIFIENELWKKKRYRTEYNYEFEREDLEKIKSLKVNFHIQNSPYSNFHEYEIILNEYFQLGKVEQLKIISSGISEALRIGVVEVEFETKQVILKNLEYKDEKNYDKVFEHITKENLESSRESDIIKSIVSEFIQFLTFNLHLNFLTHTYSFSFTDKPNLSGFSLVIENENYFYETNRMELLSHYILYEEKNDNLNYLMQKTSRFWVKDINSIHFFLDALKSNYVTSTNFIKLVFTLETFFGKNISNDYVSLVVPLIISQNISEMKRNREIIKKCFSLRNEIVHGNTLFDFNFSAKPFFKDIKNDELFFELKNLIIYIFYFYMNNDLYLRTNNVNLSHELIFEFFPTGFKQEKKK